MNRFLATPALVLRFLRRQTPLVWRTVPRTSVLLVVLVLVSSVQAGSKPPDPREILRRAEEVRSPDLDYAVDFKISVLDNYTPGKERSATYAMVAHGKDNTMVLMVTPEAFYGGTLLIHQSEYWLLMPLASKALQLSPDQVLRGDISNGDVARANLLSDYDPRLDGEETIDGEPCWRLELTPKTSVPRFSRIRYWTAKKGFFPRKFEYYGRTGAFIKSARYLDYRKTVIGMRAMKLEIYSPDEMNRTTTMTFSDLRKINASPIRFTPEGMVVFRDAAKARQKQVGAAARTEDVVAALAAEKS